MESTSLSACSVLDEIQKDALQKGRILSVADLLLATPIVIARQCQLSLSEVKGIVESVCKERSTQIRNLEDVKNEGSEIFTTGDAQLDNVLGGGIRTGMIWEIAGESAAGKTQLALQLALTVQIPPTLGGISGSTCYLVTSSTLPTSRLVQISESHPLLSPSVCNLTNIHTIATPTTAIMVHVLSKTLPDFLRTHSTSPPVKLLVIDALAELFHSSSKTTTQTLVERARNISEISAILHSLASTYQIAVLVLNEVSDVFDQRSVFSPDANNGSDLIYRDQARWFSRAHSTPGEDRKEACLGLVWANQVNARILLSRTSRRRYLVGVDSWTKKQRTQTGVDSSRAEPNSSEARHPSAIEEQTTLIRRLSVIFSSVGRPRSLDYTVTLGGVSTLSDDYTPYNQHQAAQEMRIRDGAPQITQETLCVSPDGGCPKTKEMDHDEWECYWKNNDIPDDALYDNIDLDATVNTNIESHSKPNI